MAYEGTEVPVSRSQEAIRGLVYSHRGTGVVLVSQPPQEGFEAMVMIGAQSYHMRIIATCKTPPKYDGRGYVPSADWLAKWKGKEERRVWRVLYYHLKGMFEAADSGVITLEQIVLPYVVMRDGRTLSEHIIPRMPELIGGDPARLLPGHTEVA